MTQEALKLALEWFKCYADKSMSRNNAEALADEVVEAIEKALAQTQEPVAWRAPRWSNLHSEYGYRDFDDPVTDINGKPSPYNEPLYLHPAQRTEQLKACVYCGQLVAKEKK